METDITIKKQWIYVVVQDPGTSSEELMGFASQAIDAPFIPAFESKEEAQQCFLIMPKDLLKKKYEIQAIIREDLIDQAKAGGYKIFLMDEKSAIKKELK